MFVYRQNWCSHYSKRAAGVATKYYDHSPMPWRYRRNSVCVKPFLQRPAVTGRHEPVTNLCDCFGHQPLRYFFEIYERAVLTWYGVWLFLLLFIKNCNFLSITFTFFNHFRFVLNSYWLISAILWIFEKIANSKMSNGECDIIRTYCELKGNSFCPLKYPPSFIVIALLFSFRKVRMGTHDAYSTISTLKFGKLTANKNRTTYLIYGSL